MKALLEETLSKGYKYFKLKVGGGVEEDRVRLGIAREVLGYDRGNVLMVDANQVWSVPEAISYMEQLKEFRPWFIEEPTSPDDGMFAFSLFVSIFFVILRVCELENWGIVNWLASKRGVHCSLHSLTIRNATVLGHKAIRTALLPHNIGVATGEMCQNRVMFKQFLASGAIDVCQIDACRLGGVNEVLAVLLMAAKFGVPVVPHSGGVGLPEYTQHLSTIDYVCVSGKKSVLEYVDHLHEHFLWPSRVSDGFYVTPMQPGYSVEMKRESMERFEFPGKEGVSWWRSEEARPILEGERI
jgi:L-galactonate dehydratase